MSTIILNEFLPLMVLSPVTILAFVYIPLNTVTSMYGMNIQQINGNGHRLGSFILTAIIALTITGLIWFLVWLLMSYSALQDSYFDRERHSETRSEHECGLEKRVPMFCWLLLHGHSRWLWASGAWWRLLTNSDSKMYEVNEDIKKWNAGGERGPTPNACQYIFGKIRLESPEVRQFTVDKPTDIC